MNEDLKPGLELDRQIGKVLFGDKYFYALTCESYSTDPTANKRVRDWLMARCLKGIWISYTEGEWDLIYLSHVEEYKTEVGETLEHVICLAALSVAAEEDDD